MSVTVTQPESATAPHAAFSDIRPFRIDNKASLAGGEVLAPKFGTVQTRLPACRISPRESEVLALVIEGCTNKAIADALFVSPNTVKTHVTSLLTKLDASNRAQLVTIAARRGFLLLSPYQR